MRPFKDRVRGLIDCAFGGVHHIDSLKFLYEQSEHPAASFLVGKRDLSTYDFDRLTRLVFAAHDQCLRVEVTNGGPWHMKVYCSQRARNTGSITDSHPTLEEVVAAHRKNGWKEMEEEES